MKRACAALFLLVGLSAFGFAQAQSYLRNNTFYNWESPHVHPLDITPDGTHLLAVNTPNNTLDIFSVSTSGQLPVLTASVPVGLDPVSVRARTNTEAWVVNVISDSVSIVNLSTGVVTATLQADDEPADVIFAGASQNLALISCAQAKTVLVFNAASPTALLQRIPINGEQPRALAVSANGRYVYLAIFESGNATTAVTGGKNDEPIELSIVDDKRGPYGGVNPPPNSGKNFSPAQNPANTTPPPVSMIVKRTVVGGVIKWLDDNLGDWSPFVNGALAENGSQGARVTGWDMPDRDVAIIDTGNNYAVTYQSGIMNILMSIAVNPSSGAVTVVGTDATNQIRYQENLQSTFVHVEMGSFPQGGSNSIYDLNPQITYQVKSVPVAQRQLAIGDPRGIVWNSAGTQAYVTGMGSNNVVIVGPTGARLGLIPNVGQGPTGIVLQPTAQYAYVLNKFDATVSMINTSSNAIVGTTPLSFDPTPAAIKAGRPLLYNTQISSGLGQASCGSCHVDARWDRLAWDLGDPAASMVTNAEGITFHPMKGPMRTTTLVDLIQAPFLHWRGDRPNLTFFEPTFQAVLGADNPATGAQIATLQSFLQTISLPPNPYRNLDNSFSTSVNMPGPNNTIYINGNAVLGAQEFESNCRSCHVGQTGRGANFITNQFGLDQYRNPPTWKNFYKQLGLWFSSATATTVGFGTQQDATFDSTQNQTRDANMYAFMMSFNGGFPYEPAGLNATNWSNFTHAAVGKQVTLTPSNPTDTTGLLAQLEALAGEGPGATQGAIGLIAKGAVPGQPIRGWMYLGNNLWQSDHLAEVDSTTTLNNNIANGWDITFTAVPTESAVRLGIDKDGDGLLDYDDPQPTVPNFNVTNLALNGVATGAPAYDTNHEPPQAIDGNTLGYYDQNAMYNSAGGTDDWWQVDLGTAAQISLIQMFNRWDCCGNRLANVYVFVSLNPFTSTNLQTTLSQPGVTSFFISGQAGLLPQIPMQVAGRYVRVQLNTTNQLGLAEVRVFGYAIGSFTNPGNQSSAVGSTVNLALTFTNTTGTSYTFSATGLPPGLTINSSTGDISGTLTGGSGAYAVTVTATGLGNPSTSFTWNVGTTAATPTFSPAPGSYTSVQSVTLSDTTPGATIYYTTNGTTPTTSSTVYAGTPIAINATETVQAIAAASNYSNSAVGGGAYILQLPQTITFNPIPAQTVGTTLTVAATASSGLPIAFSVVPNGNCSISGSVVTFLNTGNCGVVANQAGNSSYAPAAAVGQIIQVNSATSAPSFSVALSASSFTLAPNTGGALGVTIKPSSGFSGSVNLTAIGIPSGVGYTFYPSNPTTSSTNLVIFVPSGTKAGSYTVTVTGTSGSSSATTTLTLVIS